MSITARLLLISLITARIAAAQAPDALFQSRCASCPAAGNAVGAPLPETLRQMSWQAVLAALETGKMKPVGDDLSATEGEAIAKSLGTAVLNPMPPSAKCSAAPQRASATGNWNGWADAANTRFQPARQAGLTRQTTPKLKLEWAFGFPGVTTAFGVASVVDGKVFLGAADGSVYSLDAKSGCLYWTYAAAAGVRVSPAIGNGLVYFGDLRGNVYALDAGTGALRWNTRADEHPLAVITGSPKLEAGRLYVPVSGRDESLAATSPTYECCTFRGSVVSLDAATGNRIWRTYLVQEEARATGQNKAGTKTWGPSGVAVWSSPTLDLQNKVIYAGTGVNYSNPPTNMSDAIVALEMDSGRILWSRQFTQNDGWTFACIGISDFTAGKPEIGGGLIALQLATGKLLWLTKAPKPACAGVPGCSAAQPAPVTVIPGVAFLGSWDGHIRAYETKTGAIIWDFDTVQDFQTVNGVKARGGSINSMAPVIAGGMLYITSGYSGNAMPGNVLLAFSVAGNRRD